MKKIILSLIIIFTVIVSCKKTKTNYCYDCNVNANGNDTIMCNKTQAEIDALMINTVHGCIKTD